MVDQATASRVVGMWSEKGIKDSEQLRKLYRKQSGASLVRFTLQRLLDAGACWAVRFQFASVATRAHSRRNHCRGLRNQLTHHAQYFIGRPRTQYKHERASKF